MRIVVAGSTGFIGVPLCAALHGAGHEVVALARDAEQARLKLSSTATVVAWDGKTLGDWARQVDGSDAVVNLAGAGIADGRWTAARKRLLLDSRVEATTALVRAITAAARKPRVLVSASAVGWYGPHGDESLSESEPAGGGFLADLCAQWEAAARAAEGDCRVVLLRTGVVLGPGGGALAKMLPPFRLYFGGPLGHGRQQFSWIHRDDVIGLVQHAIATESLAGPVNATAPEPLPLGAFCTVLGRTLGRPSWAPVPGVVLRLALGELAEMLLTGQRVLPTAAEESGYTFTYRTADAALHEILAT